MCLFRISGLGFSSDAIEFNRFEEFSPVCSHHFPSGSRHKWKRNCIFFNVFFLFSNSHCFRSCWVHSTPLFFAYVMPWLLWLYRHLTLRRTNSRHSIHMLIKTTTYSYILAHRFTEKERKRKKNNNNEEKTLREADLFYTKKRKNKIGMFYRTTSSSSHSHLALPPPCVVETKANKKKKNSTLKCRWNTKPFKIPGLLLYYFFFYFSTRSVDWMCLHKCCWILTGIFSFCFIFSFQYG